MKKFLNYIKETREHFVKIAGLYSLNKHSKLRTEIDTLLTAYDQMTEKLPRWITVKNAMPEPQQRVYVLCENKYNNKVKRFQVIAEYIPYMTVKEEDYMDSDYAGDGDYNEDEDVFYAKEGFYEWQSEADINFKITAKVIGWMPLFDTEIESTERIDTGKELLKKVRKYYLVETDPYSGLPTAKSKTILKLWDKVNEYLGLKTFN